MSILLGRAIDLAAKIGKGTRTIGAKVKKGSDKIFTSSKTGVNWGARKGSFAKDLAAGVRSEGRLLRKNVTFKNIEISNDIKGKPIIKLKGATFKYLKKKTKGKKYNIHLSLSDDKKH